MKIKNHEIIHEINRGAITTVYKARHLNLKRTVLLKILNKQWLGEKDLIKRFKREAQICAHLQHPNVVNIYDFEISNDLVYISLEYIEGATLSDYIRENHPIPTDKIISLCYDLFNAMDYAHQKGVIHRDIKPENILIDDTFKAMITDFGLASFQDLPAVTDQGQGMGTPAYMAPEQIMGNKPSIQSDLYSLGITLYQAFTAENPFQKENTAATLQSVLTEELRSVDDFRSDVPQWLVKLILKLTAKKPNERPEHAASVVKEISRETGRQPLKKPITSQKNKKYSAFLAVAAIFSVLTISLYIFWPSQEKDIQKQKDPQLVSQEDTIKTIDPHFANGPSDKKNEEIIQQSAKPAEKQVPLEAALSGFGSLFVVCSPWAKIILDGDTVDITPMKQAITVKTGYHTLELLNPNYKTEIHNIEINANVNDTLNFRLKPSFGYLLVKATPWAKLYVNDQYKEDTPLEKSIIIPEGKSIIKLLNPTHGTITDTIFVEAGKTVEKTYNFIN